MRTLVFTVLAVFALNGPACADFKFNFDPETKRWDLSNGVIHGAFEFGADGKFQFRQVDHLQNGKVWKSSDRQPSSPIRVRLDSTTYDAATPYRLVDQHVDRPNAKTARQVIVLQDLQSTVQIELDLEMYESQPVLRHRVSVTNLR